MPSPLPLPVRLPSLPQAPADNPWSADIIAAYEGLNTSFNSARRALDLDESDPIRLRYHLDRASGFMVNVVEALGVREVNPLPSSHLSSLATAVGSLVFHLRKTVDEADIKYVHFFAFTLADKRTQRKEDGDKHQTCHHQPYWWSWTPPQEDFEELYAGGVSSRPQHISSKAGQDDWSPPPHCRKLYETLWDFSSHLFPHHKC